MTLPDLLAAISSATAAAALAVMYLRGKPSYKPPLGSGTTATLLFDDGILHHACNQAQDHFQLEPGTDEWEDLRDRVADQIPNFPDRPEAGVASLSGKKFAIRQLGTKTKIQFDDIRPYAREAPKNDISELETLRNMQTSLTHPVWQADDQGNVTWANDAYKRLSAGEAAADALPFGNLTLKDIPEDGLRLSITNEDSDRVDWFLVVGTQTRTGAVFNATNLNAVVSAEEAQRNFVQTLAKTFAHLSTGLAIFDRKRQLMLFNPALVDLTGLTAEFLSARPSIESFFDRLRENRRMPEPKNYRNWRQEITEVIAAASDGRYQETWSLETGQTYKVSGRPHPDGAIAFLIEDISAEISETRNSRAELELAQCLLDKVDDAMAVFSRAGILTFCNEAYRTLWEIDPKTSFAEFTIADSIGIWSGNCSPNPMWQDIEDFVIGYGERKSWDMPVRPIGRSLLRCEITPIISGATLVRFCNTSGPRAREKTSAIRKE